MMPMNVSSDQLDVSPFLSNLHELERAIDQASVISFDFFDTLFIRFLYQPEDVFDIIGKRYQIEGFNAIRQSAQVEAFRRMRNSEAKEITLAQIYDCMAPLKEASAGELLQAEYAIELALVSPNAELLPVFKKVLESGKPVVVTSDMYLPVTFFEEAFRENELPLVPFFISADRNATKRDCGELFDVLARELGVSHRDILHIGDNPVSDIKQASLKGLATFQYNELRRPPKPAHHDVDASIAVGLLRKHVAGIAPNSAKELGFLYGGPATLAFLEWIAETSKKNEIDKILFLARDGYSLSLAANTHYSGSLPEHHYFSGSRTVFTLASINERNFKDYIPFLLSGSDGLTPHEIFERIGAPVPAAKLMAAFGYCEASQIRASEHPRFAELLFFYKWEILKVCARNRRALYVYLSQLGIKDGDKIAFVDVGWSGTTQNAFEMAISSFLNIEVYGYYFCLADTPECIERRKKSRMTGFISTATADFSRAAVDKIYQNRVGIEFFFSAPHQSIIGLNVSPNGVVDAIEDTRIHDIDDLSNLAVEITEGIVEFIVSFNQLRGRLGSPVVIPNYALAGSLLDFAVRGAWMENRNLNERTASFDNWAYSGKRAQ